MSLKSLDQIRNRATMNDQYRSEEWITFSRNIREMTNFCECCKRGMNDGITKLNVHHLAYDPNRALWEYERNEVVVLCVDCHEQMHEGLKEFRKAVFGFFTPQSMRIINKALAQAWQQRLDPLVVAHAIAEMVDSPGSITRFAAARHMKLKPPAPKPNQNV